MIQKQINSLSFNFIHEACSCGTSSGYVNFVEHPDLISLTVPPNYLPWVIIHSYYLEMSPFLQGVLAGYRIAIPVGAISILIVETGLTGGFYMAFAAESGAATVDLIYSLLAVIAGQPLTSHLAPYAAFLHNASSLILIIIGLRGLWIIRGMRHKTHKVGAIWSGPSSTGEWHTYFRFIGLTIINP
jgi:arginine exporter protein ArgO